MRARAIAISPPLAPAGHPGIAARLLERVTSWLEVRRQRRQLLTMSDYMLHDIGISRSDALGEGSRPFWDMP